MLINLSELLKSLTVALDYVEKQLRGVNDGHARRVALICDYMAAEAGLGERERYVLSCASLLHDAALFEYIEDEDKKNAMERDMRLHCVKGEENFSCLPFYREAEKAILYHHERADGQGAFGLKADETPLMAQFIHAADMADVKLNLSKISEEEFIAWVKDNEGSVLSYECARLLIKAIRRGVLNNIESPDLDGFYPCRKEEVSMSSLKRIAELFGVITDYKSHFTWRHSIGIAKKAYQMGEYYGFDEDKCTALYIAGALHDIGKLMIDEAILEKPGRLTKEEYLEIQNHAQGSYELLKDIGGMEEIARWAYLHHEKLDGSGYPFGLRGENLNKMERLMAVLDIYQALVEERPYKKSMPHIKAISILREMGEKGQLDRCIINDVDKCMDDGIRSYTEDETVSVSGSIAYRCPVCGYIYEGELPDNFICPRCEQPGNVFVRIK
ncbi:MAG: HD domain-containing phosphohydrolase [Erysipelotrichaceae bacterium]